MYFFKPYLDWKWFGGNSENNFYNWIYEILNYSGIVIFHLALFGFYFYSIYFFEKNPLIDEGDQDEINLKT
jgi:hypothetical protein